MITHDDLVQGEDNWHEFRLTHRGASEAAAMLGLSKKVRRTELLHMKHTGNAKEFSDWVQEHILDHGHEAEALARPIMNRILGDDLYPVTCSDGLLSASCDGLVMAETRGWEHKQWNSELAAAVSAKELPDEFMAQPQQCLMVTGAESWTFTVSDGTEENMVSMEILPDPVWFERIRAGWAQFEIDLAEYVPSEVVIAPIAKPQMSLPAVSIQVNGSIALVDNLQAFGAALTAYVERINKEPETDQDFADLEATVKTLKAAEEALDAAENGALAQTESIDSMRRTVGLYRDTARTNRLLVTQLVKVEKENRRTKIIGDAVAELVTHTAKLTQRIGKPYLPTIAGDFQGVIKGLKSIDSMRDKVASELARCKIEANAKADLIQANLTTLRELASEHTFLFADTSAIVLKANDDLTALVKSRISDHQASEAARIATETSRIAEQERVKAEAAATARANAEIAAATAAAQAESARSIAEVIAKAAEAELTLATAPPCHQTIVPVLSEKTVADRNAVEFINKIEAKTPPSMSLGEISTRLGFNVTSVFLATLGFEATNVKAAKLFHEEDFPAICRALIEHIAEVSEQYDAVSA
jgi:predicted phage-related endonuclease